MDYLYKHSVTDTAGAQHLTVLEAELLRAQYLNAKRKDHAMRDLFFLAPNVGLEPTTLRLTAACSTD